MKPKPPCHWCNRPRKHRHVAAGEAGMCGALGPASEGARYGCSGATICAHSGIRVPLVRT